MVKLNAIDICNIQECLEGYKVLVELVPLRDEVEEEMRECRLKIIDYLSDKCDMVLGDLKNEQ